MLKLLSLDMLKAMKAHLFFSIYSYWNSNLRSVLIQFNHVMTLIWEGKITVKIAYFQKIETG